MNRVRKLAQALVVGASAFALVTVVVAAKPFAPPPAAGSAHALRFAECRTYCDTDPCPSGQHKLTANVAAAEFVDFAHAECLAGAECNTAHIECGESLPLPDAAAVLETSVALETASAESIRQMLTENPRQLSLTSRGVEIRGCFGAMEGIVALSASQRLGLGLD